jgi:hypothetical protein
MKINSTTDPTTFIALKRVSNYIINILWTIDILGNEEVEYEYKLAIARSKRFKNEIILLASIDINITWDYDIENSRDNKLKVKRSNNPWYSGVISLEDFI